MELSEKHPRYGYRRVTAVLRRERQEVNAKRVQRVRRAAGLQVRERQKRMRRLGVSSAERQRAEGLNAVWSWDFVEDQTENGTRFRVLTLIDEYSRRCLAMHVGRDPARYRADSPRIVGQLVGSGYRENKLVLARINQILIQYPTGNYIHRGPW